MEFQMTKVFDDAGNLPLVRAALSMNPSWIYVYSSCVPTKIRPRC